MIQPNGIKTLTKQGSQRKLHRLVFEELERVNKRLFKKLLLEAEVAMAHDNNSIYSAIVDRGLDCMHRQSQELILAKRNQLLLKKKQEHEESNLQTGLEPSKRTVKVPRKKTAKLSSQ